MLCLPGLTALLRTGFGDRCQEARSPWDIRHPEHRVLMSPSHLATPQPLGLVWQLPAEQRVPGRGHLR